MGDVMTDADISEERNSFTVYYWLVGVSMGALFFTYRNDTQSLLIVLLSGIFLTMWEILRTLRETLITTRQILHSLNKKSD
jgi:uncharacterized membrane protein HdeD (DUF308 family)